MGAYDDSLGSILIGSWIASLLFMLVIRETIRYFQVFKTDPTSMKIFVVLTVFIDAVSLIGDYANVYLNTITHWGDVEFIKNQYWPVQLYLLTMALVGAMVQSFLVNRYYTLTKNRLVSLVLAICVVVSFGGALGTGIILSIYSGYQDRYRAKIPVTIWMTTTVITDILIALVLIWQLYNMKTSFQSTEHLMQRLMRAAMQTGSTTSIIALCVLISFLINNASNIETGFSYVLGRVYTLTLLYNLNIRKTVKKELAKESNGGNRHGAGPTMSLDGIHVQRTAVVHMDSVDDLALTPSTYSHSQREFSDNEDKAEEIV